MRSELPPKRQRQGDAERERLGKRVPAGTRCGAETKEQGDRVQASALQPGHLCWSPTRQQFQQKGGAEARRSKWADRGGET